MKPQLKISVGDLAEFSRTGDINFHFSTRSSALEGIRGHQKVQARRGKSYESEVTLSSRMEFDDCIITVQGRADGVLDSDQVILEEIKTHRMVPDDIPQDVTALHLSQLRIYGHMYLEQSVSDLLQLRLCYFNLDSEQETYIEELASRGDLSEFFGNRLLSYHAWLQNKWTWESERNGSIEGAPFPYATFRDGQRDMSVAVYRNAIDKNQLMLQAPTGIGKTMGVLFPTIKAMPKEETDKIFYVSAKTSGQQAAEKATEDLQTKGLSIRQVTITAKDKICFTPGAPCHPDHCAFARGYYDKIRPAVMDVFASDRVLTRSRVEYWARKFQICPFELSLDLALETDVLVGDYNYVFDPSVYLRRFFESDNAGKYALLVDESHNLVDRGRAMFSASLEKKDFLQLKQYADDPALIRCINSVNRFFLLLRKDNRDEFDERGFIRFADVDNKLVRSLQRFCEVAEAALQMEGLSADHQECLLSLYFECLRFIRTVDNFDDNYAFLLQRSSRDMRIRLFCINPGPQLRNGFDRMVTSVCFSATIQPQDYYASLLGSREDANWYGLPSPFPREHLGLFIAPFVRTDYRNRQDYIPHLVDLIKNTVSIREGKYMVYFPSYDYLDAVFDAMDSTKFRCIKQRRMMCDTERALFLSQFEQDVGHTLVGFAVMGGVFAEAVDMKGDRLIGAIVVGVGLPQIDIDRDLVREHFGERGFEYAYQFPGMNRVLQTAGRVIRGEDDRGVVVLVDPRFQEQRYRHLMPRHWRVQGATSADDLRDGLLKFWGN